MATSGQELTTDRDLLWKQYELHVGLLKSYLELVLKLNLFFYAITGAVVSYYFAHPDERLLRWSLLLPVVMSVFFALLYGYGARLNVYSRNEITALRDALGFRTAPEGHVLTAFLWLSVAMFVVVAVGLVGLLLCRS